jgi:hypothetical protein
LPVTASTRTTLSPLMVVPHAPAHRGADRRRRKRKDGSQTPKAYVALTSIIGLLAFVARLQMLIAASETGLGVPMIAMVVWWAIATAHHVILARPAPARRALKPGLPPATALTRRRDPRPVGLLHARPGGGMSRALVPLPQTDLAARWAFDSGGKSR